MGEVTHSQPAEGEVSDCTRESGTCERCRRSCGHKPGWFLPGEAEKAAEFTGMTLPEFFRAYLAVDWWEGEPDIFLLSPAIAGAEPGRGVHPGALPGLSILEGC